MERRHFLTSVTSLAAIVAAAGAALAASPAPQTTTYPGSSPFPGRSPRPGSPAPLSGHRRAHGAAATPDLEHVHRRLESLIDMLERDTGDYGGHRNQAIGFLQQADSEIVAALSLATSSPFQQL